MKLLLINPNTTEAITDLVVAEAKKILDPTIGVVGATGRFGGRYVASRATYAVAGHAALDAYAAHGADALVLLTEWNAFRALDLHRLGAAMAARTIVDLRNIYRPEDVRAAGFQYTSVGRP